MILWECALLSARTIRSSSPVTGLPATGEHNGGRRDQRDCLGTGQRCILCRLVDQRAQLGRSGCLITAGVTLRQRRASGGCRQTVVCFFKQKTAYELIVTAFAQGDRRALKNLLSREVYD